jgi:very-short-patch-repair endonuclease
MKKQPSKGAHERARTLRREMTEAEKRLWQRLRYRQMRGYRFRRQVPIGSFIADSVCQEARLIVGVDGGRHDTRSELEACPTRFLESEGYRILRFWNNEVLENPDGVQEEIAQYLRRVHPHPCLPPSRGRVDPRRALVTNGPAHPVAS